MTLLGFVLLACLVGETLAAALVFGLYLNDRRDFLGYWLFGSILSIAWLLVFVAGHSVGHDRAAWEPIYALIQTVGLLAFLAGIAIFIDQRFPRWAYAVGWGCAIASATASLFGQSSLGALFAGSPLVLACLWLGVTILRAWRKLSAGFWVVGSLLLSWGAFMCGGQFLYASEGTPVWPYAIGGTARLSILTIVILLYIDRARREALEQSQRVAEAQKMEAIGRLAGGVAHDFNNYLTVVLSGLEFIRRSEGLPEEGARWLDNARRAADRAAALSRQLLAFNRRQGFELSVVRVDELVRDMADLIRPLIGDQIDLVFSDDGRAATILCDPTQLQQVVLNLSINARDAMPEGGRLTIHTELNDRTTGKTKGELPGSWVTLSVRDTGHGMDAYTQTRVFEPFFTTKPSATNAGLGLATVFGVVKQAGGRIEVDSRVGHGTTFRVSFPVRVGAPPTAPVIPPPTQVEPVHRTVLVAEDEDMLRVLVTTILERAGYKVIATADGAEAWRVAEVELDRIDVLVTDVVMPKLNGVALAKKVRERRAHLPVVFMSGYPDQIASARDLLGANQAFLGKPFHAEQLTRVVERMLLEPACAATPAAEG